MKRIIILVQFKQNIKLVQIFDWKPFI